MGLRERFGGYLPSWLSDNGPDLPSYGYRFLRVLAASVDMATETMLQASVAAVGRGTPTALKYLGEARGVIRGQLDTDDEYIAKLRNWIERNKARGSARGIAREIHEYLGNKPRVRVISRGCLTETGSGVPLGTWTTVDTDGSVSVTVAPWDWDSVTNPERAGYWSEQWVVVYPSQWDPSGTLGDGRLIGDADRGIGHLVSRQEVDTVKLLLDGWKAARSRIRCVIWTTDATLFDPENPASCPDGTWGTWSRNVAGHCVPSGRNRTTCRYWEPR